MRLSSACQVHPETRRLARRSSFDKLRMAVESLRMAVESLRMAVKSVAARASRQLCKEPSATGSAILRPLTAILSLSKDERNRWLHAQLVLGCTLMTTLALSAATCQVSAEPTGKLTIVSATASGSTSADYGPAKAIDGNTGTWWYSNTTPCWIELSLGSEQQVNGIWFDSGANTAREAVDYKIQTWNSQTSSWTDQATVTGNNWYWSFHSFPLTQTSKVRIYISATADSDRIQRIQEAELYYLLDEEARRRNDDSALARQIPSLIAALRQPAADLVGTRSLVVQQGLLTVTERPLYWFMSSADVEAAIDKATGAIVNLKSRKPTTYDVVHPTTNGLLTYVWNRDQVWFDVLNSLSDAQVTGGKEDGKDYVRITGKLDFSDPSHRPLLDATLVYTLWPDRFDVRIDLAYKQSDPSLFEISALQAYTPSDWQSIVLPGSAWHITLPTSMKSRRIMGFADDATNSYEFGVWHPEFAIGGHGPSVSYPFGVLERADRYFLWGYRDVGAFTILAPQNQGSAPCFLIAPKSIQAGKHYAFDFSYKFFPKSDYGYTEVVRWYAQNVHSSEPVSAGIVALPQSVPHKTIPEGNYGGYGTTWSSFSRLFPYAYLDNERAMLSLKMVNTHNAYWNKWDDTYPSSGNWWAWDSTLRQFSADAFKADIKRQQSKGIKCLLYFRQLLNTAGLRDDRPPYKSWTKKFRDGREFPYAGQWMSGIPQHIAQSEGLDPNMTYGWVYADFQNDQFRNWYIQQVKNCIDYYGLDGVYWDMGWMDIGMGYTASDPEGGSGIHHGILCVQYEIYQYLKSKNPPGFVITNLSLASPTAIWSDAVMFEGGQVDKRTVEAQKAFNTAIVNLSYSESFPGQAQEHIHTIMRALSYGTSWGGHGYEFFEHPDPKDPARNRNLGLYLLPLTELAAISARTNSVAMVTESKAITVNSADISASAWAGAEEMIVAVYNDNASLDVSFRVELSQAVLAGYGVSGSPTLARTLFGANGLPTADVTGTTQTVSGGKIVLQGTLPARHLLVLMSRPLANEVEVHRVGQLRQVDARTVVVLNDKVVTASFAGGRDFYVEEDDRSAGARIFGPSGTAQGDRVNVRGDVISAGDEKAVNATAVVRLSSGNALPGPVGVGHRSIPGGGMGASVSGLLGRSWGRVAATHSDGTLAGSYMKIDDGASLPGSEPGLRVNAVDVGGYPWFLPPAGSFVVVTGVYSWERDGCTLRPCIRPRAPGDIVVQ